MIDLYLKKVLYVSFIAVLLLASSIAYGKDTLQLTMDGAIDLALKQNPSVLDAQRNLDDAKTTLEEKEADPTTLILELTQAKNSFVNAQVQLNYTKLQVTQTVRDNYFTVLEAQNQLNLAKKQLDIANKNLDITKAKKAQGNATDSDVIQAENSVISSQNSVAQAQASLKNATDKLALSLGIDVSTPVTLTDVGFNEVNISLDGLGKQAQDNLPTVVQAKNNATLAQLQFDLANNDYTPQDQIRTVKSSLLAAQSNLQQVLDNLSVSIQSSYQNVINALNQVKLQEKNLSLAQKNLDTDRVRYKVGSITQVQLMNTELSLMSAENNYKSAVYNYYRALDSLALATGVSLVQKSAK